MERIARRCEAAARPNTLFIQTPNGFIVAQNEAVFADFADARGGQFGIIGVADAVFIEGEFDGFAMWGRFVAFDALACAGKFVHRLAHFFACAVALGGFDAANFPFLIQKSIYIFFADRLRRFARKKSEI
jgi:hypothetical protein